MSRRDTVPLDDAIREKIHARLEEKGMSRAELARRAGYKSRSDVTLILNGTRQSTGRSKLLGIARALDLDPGELRIQHELALEIDEKFISTAQSALRIELERLRDEVGRVTASRVSGSIGVHFHGPPLERRSIEREFRVELKTTERGS